MLSRLLTRAMMVAPLAIVLTVASCSKDKEEEVDPCAYDASQLKYNGLIKTIINTSCANNTDCHASPNSIDGGGELVTYAQVKEKFDDGVLRSNVIVTRDMPKGSSLSVCDFKKMEDWINAGAPE